MAQGALGIPAGVTEQFYAADETTFATFAKPAATDAIRVISSSFTPAQERVNRKDKRNSRSVSERITRKKSAEWQITVYALPSGTAGTPPDISELLEALFGTYTNTPAASDVYTLSSAISKSFSLSRILDNDFAESVTGAVVNRGVFRFRGEEECEIELSGPAANWVRTYATTLAASAAASATTITLTDDYSVGVGSVIKIGSDDNSGAGYEVTAWNETTNVATIESGLSASAASATTVSPTFATATTAGDPVGCVTGTFQLDSTAYYVTEFEITIDNNVSLLLDEFGSSVARGYYGNGFRNVEFTGTMYLQTTGTAKNSFLPGQTETFTNVDIEIQAGATAGAIMHMQMPTAEFDVMTVSIPEEDSVTLELSGKGIAPSVLESEITLTFQ